MKMLAAVLVVLTFAGALAEDPVGPAVTTYPAANFTLKATPAPANAVSSGGYSDKRMVTQWPALDGMGISMSVFTLQPCALRPPHFHQYASGILYVISASNLTVGFTSTNGTAIITSPVPNGATTLFPQGLLHYQLNEGCDVASYIITYGSDNPGTQVLGPSLVSLPASVIAATFGMNNATAIDMDVPTSDFIANSDAACMQRCGMTAPAAAPTVGVSTAGK